MSDVHIKLILLISLIFSLNHLHADISVNVNSLPVTIEPPEITDQIGAWVVGIVGERLVNVDRKGFIRGGLAKKWKISKKGKTYSFDLRNNIKFSDGETVTSSRVVNFFNEIKMKKKKGYISFYFTNINKIYSKKNKIVFELYRPMDGFLKILSESAFTIYKKCETNICFTTTKIVEKIEKKELIIKDSRNNTRFILREMSFKSALTAFKKKKLSILRSYGFTNLLDLKKLKSKYFKMIDERSYFLALNSKSKVFHDLYRRKYLARGLNLKGSRKYLSKFGLKLSNSLLSDTYSMGRETLKGIPMRTELKYKNEAYTLPKFDIITMKSQELRPLGQILLDKVKNKKIISLTKKKFISRFLSGDYDALLVGYGSTLRDLDFFSTFFYSKSMHNMAKVNDNSVDSLINLGWNEFNPNKQIEYISVLLKLNAELIWYIPITHSPLYFYINENIKYNGRLNFENRNIGSSNLDITVFSK